jgi:hypothetical protein
MRLGKPEVFPKLGMWDASITPREILVSGSTPARRAEAAPSRAVTPWENLKFFPNPFSSYFLAFLRWSSAAYSRSNHIF